MLIYFDRFVLTFLLFSVQATVIKVGDLQLFEASVLALLPYLVLRHRGFFASRPLVLFLPIIVFFLLTSLLLFFRVDFFPPPGIGPLKFPFIISLVRMVQITMIFLAFNYAWLTLDHAQAVRWAMKRYVDISVIIAALTCLSFLLANATGFMSPLVYDTAYYLATSDSSIGMLRARGLFVEGGPYGLSLIPSIVFAGLLRTQGKASWVKIALLAAALILSQSKAALVCAFLLLLIHAMSTMKLRKLLVSTTSGFALVAVVLFVNRAFLEGFFGYYETLKKIAGDSIIISSTNFDMAYGRVAAMFIAPRMAADNPILGVGLGNYSLTRNNPLYLGSFPQIEGWDLSGLGIFTLLLEGGIAGLSLLLASYFLFSKPSRAISGKRFYFFLVPLLLQCCGVQLYFAYHWFFLLMLALFLDHKLNFGMDNPPAHRSLSP